MEIAIHLTAPQTPVVPQSNVLAGPIVAFSYPDVSGPHRILIDCDFLFRRPDR
jgi:hypothetical protein